MSKKIVRKSKRNGSRKAKPGSLNPVVRPSLEGPFHALEAKEVNSKQTKCLVVTYEKAVCDGNFSVLAECNNWKDAVFLAYACNEVLGLCGIRFVIHDAKRYINRALARRSNDRTERRGTATLENQKPL